MISMTEAQYTALLRYAEQGAATLQETPNFLTMREDIDSRNGVTRHVLVVRWQAVPAGPVPAGTTGYPPFKYTTLQLTRPITRQDVDERLQGERTGPGLVHVTPDPQGLVGWSLLEDFDF